MTLYCQKYKNLDGPIQRLANRLGKDCKYSTVKENNRTTEYHFEWPDFKVSIYASYEDSIKDHLEGFLGYCMMLSDKLKINLEKPLVKRIKDTKLVLGFVASPSIEDESRRDRFEDILGSICYHTKSLLFWEMQLYDENASLILGVND